MSNATQVETVSTGADKAKIGLAAVLLVGSVVAFYLLSAQDIWLRVAALLALIAASVGVFLVSEPGRQFVGYARESVRETKKVVWPTR
ncbi:MAG: preprotein translocase subunit SecE, partial [Betaproteobacteria bacterium]